MYLLVNILNSDQNLWTGFQKRLLKISDKPQNNNKSAKSNPQNQTINGQGHRICYDASFSAVNDLFQCHPIKEFVQEVSLTLSWQLLYIDVHNLHLSDASRDFSIN